MSELSLFDPMSIFDPQEILAGNLYPTGGCPLVINTESDVCFLNITFCDSEDLDYPTLPELLLGLDWIPEMRSKDFLLIRGLTTTSSGLLAQAIDDG